MYRRLPCAAACCAGGWPAALCTPRPVRPSPHPASPSPGLASLGTAYPETGEPRVPTMKNSTEAQAPSQRQKRQNTIKRGKLCVVKLEIPSVYSLTVLWRAVKVAAAMKTGRRPNKQKKKEHYLASFTQYCILNMLWSIWSSGSHEKRISIKEASSMFSAALCIQSNNRSGNNIHADWLSIQLSYPLFPPYHFNPSLFSSPSPLSCRSSPYHSHHHLFGGIRTTCQNHTQCI